MEGWICPRCGKVNAPWMAQCTCSNNSNNTDLSKVYCQNGSVVSTTQQTKFEGTSSTSEQMICS